MQNIWLYVHFPELAIEAVLLDMDKLPIDKPIAISSRKKMHNASSAATNLLKLGVLSLLSPFQLP